MIEFFSEDCLTTLRRIEDSSIDLIVTSPPYNKGYYTTNRRVDFYTLGKKVRKIDYGVFEDNMEPGEYEQWQREILTECCRVIKPTGSIFYNHKDILANNCTIHPKWVYDFPLKQVIVWEKPSTPQVSNAYFYPVTEYIFWIKKNTGAVPYFDKNAVFQKKCVWHINAEKGNPHPAAFPIEIPENIIAACSREGDMVFDPFMGSGTVGAAAAGLGRNFMGCEINPEYIKMAQERIF